MAGHDHRPCLQDPVLNAKHALGYRTEKIVGSGGMRACWLPVPGHLAAARMQVVET